MKTLVTLILPYLLIFNCRAQIMYNLNGTSVQEKDFSDIKGSPYYLDQEWLKGTVIFGNNSVRKDMDLKYNLLEDMLYFKSSNQKILAFGDPIKEFTINNPSDLAHPTLFRDGYENIPGISRKSFLEVLVDGKIQLLKKLSKRIREENVYPNTSINKYFIDSKQYYLYVADKGILIKNDKESILSILSDKKVQLENYIKENNLNLKEDSDLEKLIAYHNSI